MTELSDYERATVERIDAAEAAPESLRERVLYAMREARETCDLEPWTGAYWQRIADAAIAVMRGET